MKGEQVNHPGFVISLGAMALNEAARLARIPIAMLGRWVKGHQKFSIGREDFAQIVANFRKRGTGEVVIDYEHASEFPQMAAGGPVPAAGWLRGIEDAPDDAGILWGVAEFTERARKMIASLEYKYLSPAIDWAARDKGTGEPQGATLTSMALVNRPFLETLPAVQLSETGWSPEEGGNLSGNIFDDLAKLDEYIGKLTSEKLRSGGTSYKLALQQVQRENPALLTLREALYMRRERGRHSAKTLEWIDGQLKEVADNLKALTLAAMQAHPELSYGAASKLVAREHPDLVGHYEAVFGFRDR